MNTTTFTAGDVIRFESGTMYQVLGIEPDGRILARGLRDGQLFGSQRLLDPARCKLVRHTDATAHAVQEPVQQALPEPAPTTGSIPRVSVWETIAHQETSLHKTIHAARLGNEVKDAVDRIVSAIAHGERPDQADYEPIRTFVDHIDTLEGGR